MTTRQARIAHLTLTAGLALSAHAALGQTINWIAPGSGDWGTAANWQGGNIPNTNTETALLDGMTPYTVTMGHDYVIKSLEILSAMPSLSILHSFGLGISEGNLINHGTITVNNTAGGGNTYLIFLADGTLGGTGTVVLNANPGGDATARIYHSTAAVTTTIGPGQTIRGTGRFQNGTFVNQGTVRADSSGKILHAVNCTMSGAGQFLADNGGILGFNGANILGATLSSQNGGVCRVTAVSTASSATNNGELELANGTSFISLDMTDGTLTNNGTITVNNTAGGGNTYLTFLADGTLGGTGTVVLNANPGGDATARIYHSTTAVTTTIGPEQTLRGMGRLETGTFVLEGVLAPGRSADATLSIRTVSATLTFSPSARVEIDIGGTASGEYDTIPGTGTKNLGGTLTVTALPTYTPAALDEFAIISGTSVAGQFATVNLPFFANTPYRSFLRYEPTRVVYYIPCPSDFDGDGFISGDDFDAYIAAFEAGEPTADFNQDGFVSGDDFDGFVAAFEGGC